MSGKLPEGKIGEDGSLEFDSADFEDDVPAKDDESDGKDDAGAAGDGKNAAKTKADETPASDGKSDAADDDAGAENADADEAADDAKPSDEPAGYKPTLTYKAYGQEKPMPAWAEKVITDKASEDEIRTLLSKADGLDEMKPRHQQTVQERDAAMAETENVRQDVRRIMSLRDTNPTVFFAKIGVSDDAILEMAKKIVRAKDPENPGAYSEFNNQRTQAIQLFDQQVQNEISSSQNSKSFQQVHAEAMQSALTRPDVQTFAQQYDARFGEGAFQRQVNQHGSYEYQRTKQNISPFVAVQQTLEFLSKGFQPAQQPPAAPAAGTQQRQQQQPPARPAALPNLGKGKAASPAKPKIKRIKDLRKLAEKESARG